MLKENKKYFLIAKTEEEQMKILKILEEKGFTWNGGDAATSFVPSRRTFPSGDVIYIYPAKNLITYGYQQNIKEYDVEIKLSNLKPKVIL